MKKLGIIIFIAAIVSGIVLANVFSWGRYSPQFVNFSFTSKVKGSGNVVTEKRNASGFDSIDVGGVFVVEVKAGESHSIEVEADDNLLQYIETKVKGDTLKIYTSKRLSSHGRIKVRVSAPNIKAIEVSGASRTSVSGIDNESLVIDSGGAAQISVSGKTSKLTVDMGGASNVDAGSLESVAVFVDGGGASKASVSVSQKLNVDLGGASRVVYSGNPENISKETSGGSSISQRD